VLVVLGDRHDGIVSEILASPQIPTDVPLQLALELAEEEPGYLTRQLAEEEAGYLTRQLITYIGNKRALLGPIRSAVEEVRRRTGKQKLRMLDAFSGSGVVSRMFKQYASELVANDIEEYARWTSECYLSNRSAVDFASLSETAAELRRIVECRSLPEGFIRELYSPRDADAIRPGERVFYTPENAYRLDAFCQLLIQQPLPIRTLLTGPLLSEASIHANTAGVFKGFYKSAETGIGKFGGTGADALSRITAPIELEVPVLSRFECDYEIHQSDANELIRRVGEFDVAYFDPPYNQHPYGSNYFMLNLLVRYERPSEISRVSGIPTTWTRSGYNVRSLSLKLLRELVTAVDSSFVIISFNDEGYIAPAEMRDLLTSIGRVTEHSQPYATYRGSRNLRNRSIEVTEHVYVVEKG